MIKKKLHGGYDLEVLEGTEFLIDQIWRDQLYDEYYEISDNSTVIDLGANQGVFTIYAASKGARVFCYEPEPCNYNILKSNINRNALNSKVISCQSALSKDSGILKMYMTKGGDGESPGLFTSSMTLVEKNGDLNIETVNVKSITLEDVLKKHSLEYVQLLKVDCEGSELDILLSTNDKCFEKIENIVMKTHDNYSQKAMCNRLIELGYEVISYKKMDGDFSSLIFCLYATRKKNDKNKQEDGVLALLKSDDYYFESQTCIIDASESFDFVENDKLEFKWYVNNIEIEGEYNSILKMKFDSCGIKEIKVEVLAGMYKDFDRKRIWILEDKYFKKKQKVKLGKEYESINVNCLEKKCFEIGHVNFPKTWLPKRIVVSIESKVEGAEIDGFLFFNGEKITISGYYQEVDFECISPSMDLLFDIKLNQDVEVTMLWWGTSELKIETKNEIDNPEIIENGTVIFKTSGKEIEHEVNLYQKYYIDKSYFPTDWIPNKIIIQISAMDHKAIKGECKYDKNTIQLVGDEKYLIYQDITIKDLSLNENLEFEIITPEKRFYKVLWWAE